MKNLNIFNILNTYFFLVSFNINFKYVRFIKEDILLYIMKANITLSLDLKTIDALNRAKERLELNRSKMIRYLFVFFDHSPEQLDKIVDWTEKYLKLQKH